MCEPPGLSALDVLSEVGSTVKAAALPVAVCVAGAFVVTHAVLIAVAVGVPVLMVSAGTYGCVRFLQRFMRVNVAAAPVRRVQRAAALPRNLAITAGQRAIEAPRTVLPGQVAEGEKVAR